MVVKGFCAKVSGMIAQEPTILAPKALQPAFAKRSSIVTIGLAATLAMVAAMAVAVAASHLIVRKRVRVRGAIEWLLSLPWAVPGTVFAIALATMFAVRAPLAGRVVLIGTIVGIAAYGSWRTRRASATVISRRLVDLGMILSNCCQR